MNITGLQPFNENPEKGTRITPIFHALDPIERTSTQIAILRGILTSTGEYLGHQNQVGVEDTVPKEVRDAAAKTACLTFSQLDNIIDDMSRWTASDDEQMGALKALLAAETRRAESEHAKARLESDMVRLMMTPFMQQRGMLLQRNDGKYIAVNESQSFMSVADTPQKAIDKFNIEFINPEPKPKKRRAKPKSGPKTS